jgi:hypothetical protein
MSASDQYRKLAAELRTKGRAEASPTVKAELIHLAQCYVRLAEQADRNQHADVTYEPALRSRRDDGDMSAGGNRPRR